MKNLFLHIISVSALLLSGCAGNLAIGDDDGANGNGNNPVVNGGNTNTGGTNTGNTNTGNTNTGNTDTGNTDTGNTDTGNTDTGNTDTGNTDTGNTDTGETDTTTPPPGSTRKTTFQEFEQPSKTYKKLDLLFVTDTSTSLQAERDQIAAKIDEFVLTIPAEVSIRAAVMLGHMGFYSGKLYKDTRSGSGDPSTVLTDDKMAEFRAGLKAKLGSGIADKIDAAGSGKDMSDGGEALMYSITQGLQGSKLATIKGWDFLHDDAVLAVVFVTDENDICSRYLTGMQFHYDDVAGEKPAYDARCVSPAITHSSVFNLLKTVHGKNPLVVAGIVYTGQGVIPIEGNSVESRRVSENSIGYGITNLVQEASGLAVDLADTANIPNGLKKIGEQTADQLDQRTSFILNQNNIDATSIKVFVNGSEIPKARITFVAADKMVKITAADAGSFNDKIKITYDYFEPPAN